MQHEKCMEVGVVNISMKTDQEVNFVHAVYFLFFAILSICAQPSLELSLTMKAAIFLLSLFGISQHAFIMGKAYILI